MSKAKSESKQREALTKKQMKNKSKLNEMKASEDTQTHLIERPKEYNVKFRYWFFRDFEAPSSNGT